MLAPILKRCVLKKSLSVYRFGRGISESVIALLSTWPRADLCIRELLSDQHLRAALNPGQQISILVTLVPSILFHRVVMVQAIYYPL